MRYRMPDVCPVCLGRGKVQDGFYDTFTGYWQTNTTTMSEPCRTCLGQGIVWEQLTPPHDDDAREVGG